MDILHAIMFGLGYLFFSVLTSYVILGLISLKRKISQYFEKHKERKEHANNLLNYSSFYAEEKFKEEMTMTFANMALNDDTYYYRII